MMSNKKSGRLKERHTFIVVADIDDGEKDLFAVCGDISKTGLFIRTSFPLPVGRILRLRFRFPYDLSEFATDAVVKWNRGLEGNAQAPGMGLEFINQTPDESRDLGEHLDYYSSKGRGRS